MLMSALNFISLSLCIMRTRTQMMHIVINHAFVNAFAYHANRMQAYVRRYFKQFAKWCCHNGFFCPYMGSLTGCSPSSSSSSSDVLHRFAVVVSSPMISSPMRFLDASSPSSTTMVSSSSCGGFMEHTRSGKHTLDRIINRSAGGKTIQKHSGIIEYTSEWSLAKFELHTATTEVYHITYTSVRSALDTKTSSTSTNGITWKSTESTQREPPGSS